MDGKKLRMSKVGCQKLAELGKAQSRSQGYFRERSGVDRKDRLGISGREALIHPGEDQYPVLACFQSDFGEFLQLDRA
jgi:hypothetical protein